MESMLEAAKGCTNGEGGGDGLCPTCKEVIRMVIAARTGNAAAQTYLRGVLASSPDKTARRIAYRNLSEFSNVEGILSHETVVAIGDFRNNPENTDVVKKIHQTTVYKK